MKAVSLNDKTDVVKPQESPSTQAHVTEIPPTTPPPPVHQHQDKSSLNEVNKAAAYQNPEVDNTSYLVSQWQMRSVAFREKWKTMDQLILVQCSLKLKVNNVFSPHVPSQNQSSSWLKTKNVHRIISYKSLFNIVVK